MKQKLKTYLFTEVVTLQACNDIPPWTFSYEECERIADSISDYCQGFLDCGHSLKAIKIGKRAEYKRAHHIPIIFKFANSLDHKFFVHATDGDIIK